MFTVFISYKNFLLCEGLIGCYSSWLDYWQKFNVVRHYLTEIQIPKSTRIFDYHGPFIHISKLVSKRAQSNRPLFNEIHLNAKNCKFSFREKKNESAAQWL